MKNLLLTLSLSLAALPVCADVLGPTKGTDLPPARTTAPAPAPAPAPAAAPAEPAAAAPAAKAAAAPAPFAALSGWYVGADLGWNNASDADWTFTTGAHPVPFEDGWVGALKMGTRVMGVRAELEYAHRSNDAQYFGPPGSIDNARGKISSDALMLNAYYDFAPTGKVTPFLGIGVGAAWVDAEDIRKNITGCCSGIVDGDDTVAAGQVMAGAAYAVSRNLDLTLEYRFFFSQEPSFDYATACDSTDSIGSCGVAGSTSDDYYNHSILAGLRYRF